MKEILLLLDSITSSNFIYVLILILVYGFSQKITIEQLKVLIDGGEKEFKKNFNKSIKASSIVNGMLDKLLYSLNADRVYVFQYHNGGSNITGIPFARCSNTHERCEVGVESKIGLYQGLPLAMYGFRNDLIADNKVIKVQKLEDIRETDKSAYNLMKDQNIKSLYVAGLYTDKCMPLGFLGVDYIRQERILTEEDLNILVTSAHFVSNCICQGVGNEHTKTD